VDVSERPATVKKATSFPSPTWASAVPGQAQQLGAMDTNDAGGAFRAVDAAQG